MNSEFERMRLEHVIGMPKRAIKVFHRCDFTTVGDILKIKDREAFLKIRDIGIRTYFQTLKALEDEGFDVSHLR